MCYFLVRSSPGRSLVIYSTSVLRLAPLKLSERKMTCLSLEKCYLLLTPLAGMWKEKTHGSVKHHLLSPSFSSSFLSCKLFERLTLLPVSQWATKPWLDKTTLIFLQKDMYLSQWPPHGGVGKDRAKPTEVFHCVRPIAGHTASRQDAHGHWCLWSGDANKTKGETIHWLNLNWQQWCLLLVFQMTWSSKISYGLSAKNGWGKACYSRVLHLRNHFCTFECEI